jgi:hypothetical protein
VRSAAGRPSPGPTASVTEGRPTRAPHPFSRFRPR